MNGFKKTLKMKYTCPLLFTADYIDEKFSISILIPKKSKADFTEFDFRSFR